MRTFLVVFFVSVEVYKNDDAGSNLCTALSDLEASNVAKRPVEFLLKTKERRHCSSLDPDHPSYLYVCFASLSSCYVFLWLQSHFVFLRDCFLVIFFPFKVILCHYGGVFQVTPVGLLLTLAYSQKAHSVIHAWWLWQNLTPLRFISRAAFI